VLTYLLLQNGPDMGVGGVGGQSEYRPGQGVRQGNCGDEGLFGGGEGCPATRGGLWGYLRVRR
jgi:hypothetical protein